MKKLIINADDVGFSREMNEAVKLCYEKGIITGVSVMACGASFSEAVAMLREMGIKEVGVHLTLTDTMPPCVEDKSRISSLVDKKGSFSKGYKGFALRYFSRGVKARELYRELSCQIETVLDEGFTVTHLDSHEHVHMFPDIFKTTLRLALNYEIPYVRIPIESSHVLMKKLSVRGLLRYAALRFFTRGKRRQMNRLGMKHNDAFFGHYHAGRLDEEAFRFMLDNLSDGLNEITFHPCISSEELFAKEPWYKRTVGEIDILTDPKWKDYIRAKGIDLVTHKGDAVS